MEVVFVPVREGDLLNQKYRVERVLGAGGMGVVVAAVHVQLEQRVAIKFLRREAQVSRLSAERFAREARAVARFKSEHVARILDVDLLDDGTPYIVMECLEGTDLAEMLRRDGPLPVAVVADYITQSLDAVAEAHAMGLVHRDLKPENLFLTRRADGSAWVKVLDFGISKAEPVSGEASLTRTQSIIGTPNYMSPEHMRSSKLVDARSDIWSLGVILFELVSGRLPFAADGFPDLVLKVAMEEPGPLLTPRSIPAEFEAVIKRCLDRDPARRFQNAADLADSLAPFAPPAARPIAERIRNLIGRHAPVATQGATVVTGAQSEARGEGGTLTYAQPFVPDDSAEVRRRGAPFARRMWVLAAFAAVAAAGGALVGALRGGGDQGEAPGDRTPPAALRPAQSTDALPRPPRAATAAPLPAADAETKADGPSTSVPAGDGAASAAVADEAPARPARAQRRRASARARRAAKQKATTPLPPRDPLATPE